MNRMFDQATNIKEAAYPPYDIEKVSDDDYRITVALAGFGEDDLSITVQDGVLVIAGKGAEDEAVDSERYLYRGIAKRAFERRFKLAETIRVLDAKFENGLLVVNLQREVPEHLKPREIQINSGAKKPKVIEGEAA
ncbi:Hsp20 family protein [Glycomyces mayteni]|uniref:Hsp20 family protein n=1 Tax=Glycomyces mayteni TaxID=543887 RepID=A0ABW2DED2_9ACTN